MEIVCHQFENTLGILRESWDFCECAVEILRGFDVSLGNYVRDMWKTISIPEQIPRIFQENGNTLRMM